MKLSAMLWTLLIFFFAAFSFSKLAVEKSIETDIFTIIPSVDLAVDFKQAADHSLAQQENIVVYLIKSENLSDLLSYAKSIRDKITESSLLTFVDNQNTWQSFYQALYPYRNNLLSDNYKTLLLSHDAQALKAVIENNFLDAMSFGASQRFMKDPLGLFESFLQSQNHYSDFQQIDGINYISKSVFHYSILSARINGSVFDTDVQKAFTDFELSLSPDQTANSEISSLGVIHHATESRKIALNEISTIGSLSAFGILLLFILTFRSLKPVLFALLILTTGIVCATSFCLLMFGRIHLLTLVFGASIIGIAIDYAFHFFAHYYTLNESGQQTLKKIRVALLLGLITSLCGFSSLLLTNFPALMQLAVFAIGGLSGSFLSVYFWLQILPARKQAKQVLRIKHPLADIFQHHPVSFYPVLALLAVCLSVLIISPPKTEDDIRLLKIDFPHLDERQTELKQLTQNNTHRGFFLVRANSLQELLEHEEWLTSQLNVLVKDQSIQGYSALSQYLPSVSSLKHNQELLTRGLLDNQLASNTLRSIGLKAEIVESTLKDLSDTSMINEYIQQLPSLLESLPVPQRYLGQFDSRYFSQVQINTNKEFSLDEIQLSDNVIWYDKVSSINSMFTQFRTLAIEFLSIAYLCVALLFCWRYGIKKGFATLIPSMTAITLTFVILSAFGVTINLFHILASIIVLAVGIDFTLFINESKSEIQAAILAATLSATTTVLAFGLLAFSATAALASFGQIIFIGILAVYILAPVTLSITQTSKSGT